MYCSPLWSPTLKRDISAVERVQWRFTKCIYDMRELSYTERLQQMLGTLSLQSRRLFVAIVTIFKCQHSLMECTPAAIGLSIVTSNTRGQGVRLKQRLAHSGVCSSLFSCRALSEWNSLPLRIVNCQSLTLFKKKICSNIAR